MTKAIPGRKYRHQDGGKYLVLHLARDTRDDSPVVVYENLDDGRVWVRGLNEFQGWRNAMPRFALLDY